MWMWEQNKIAKKKKKAAFRVENESTYPFPDIDSFSCFPPETGRLVQDFSTL